MYDYEEFKNMMIKDLPGALGKRYSDYKIRTMPVNKRGRIKDGFCLYREEEESEGGVQLMPTLYFDDIYEDYKDTEDYAASLDNVVRIMKNGLVHGRRLKGNVDFKKVRERVVFQLVNTENSRSLLACVPHRKFLDLSIIYRWIINVDEHGFSSTLITNELAECIGIDETELYERAYKNTKMILPANIVDFDDMLRSSQSIHPDPDNEEMWDLIGDRLKMYMLTNNRGTLGASVLLYDSILSDISERLGGDIYVLPSSVNEVIAVSVKDADPDSLLRMVQHVNSTEVGEQDFLSDNIYYYSRSAGRLYTVASDMVI